MSLAQQFNAILKKKMYYKLKIKKKKERKPFNLSCVFSLEGKFL